MSKSQSIAWHREYVTTCLFWYYETQNVLGWMWSWLIRRVERFANLNILSIVAMPDQLYLFEVSQCSSHFFLFLFLTEVLSYAKMSKPHPVPDVLLLCISRTEWISVQLKRLDLESSGLGQCISDYFIVPRAVLRSVVKRVWCSFWVVTNAALVQTSL